MRNMYHPKLVSAARELCRMRNVDPDQETRYHDQARPVSRWMVVAEEIISHLEIRKAMMSVGLHGIDQIPTSVADEGEAADDGDLM